VAKVNHSRRVIGDLHLMTEVPLRMLIFMPLKSTAEKDRGTEARKDARLAF